MPDLPTFSDLKTRKSTIVIVTLMSVLWLTGTVSFLMQEAVHDKCETQRLLVNGACQMIVVVLGLWTLRSRTDIAIIAVTVAVTYYSTCINNGESTLVWLNGLRRYLPYIFFLPIVRWLWVDPERRKRFIRVFDRNIYIFLWIQFPCLCFQAIVWGMGDYGGGSLGWYCSGIISQLIYLISFYLMVRAWRPERGYVGNLLDNWVLVALLFPSFLNETKISFIFLPLYFVMLIPFDRNLPRTLLVVIPMLIAAVGGASWWYLSYVDRKGEVLKADFFANYVMGDNMIDFAFDLMDSDDVDTDNVWESDYARGIKFALLPTLLERGEKNNELWGYGVGQFKGGNFTEKTKFAKRYEWFLRGTQTEMFDIVVELGYLGATLLILYWVVVFRFFKHAGRGNRNKRMQLWLGGNMLLMIMYTVGFDSLPYVIIALTQCFISSRWKELPAFEKPYIFFPPRTAQIKKQLVCRPS